MDRSMVKQAAKNMLAVNMNLQPGEKVLFVTDIPLESDWEKPLPVLEDLTKRALFARNVFDLVKEEFPQNDFDFLAYAATCQNGAEPAEAVGRTFEQYDVVILMNSYSLSHTNARTRASQKGVRIASMPGIEAEMFSEGGPMQADYLKVKEVTAAWAQKITAAGDVRVVSASGTDITFSIKGRPGLEDHGLFGKKGDWGNLPAGEAYTAPVEGTANGKLVAPAGWYPDLIEDMIFEFKDGLVFSVTGGGKVGDMFREAYHFDDPTFLHRRNCAELGIGTNPNAKRADNVLEAEKIAGTIHIAIGDSAHMCGVTESDMHEDFVIPQPTVFFDGVKVIG
ncbi:MAG: aminopeptidase [Anaerolineae bacterium]|nr:aminopeptidase [Anaerolineae bacterium]